MDFGKYSTITFCTENYKEYNDDTGIEDVNYFEYYRDISEFIRIAIKNGFQMKVWSDELTVVIEYNYKDESLSGVSLEWLGEDEYIETAGKCEECITEAPKSVEN